LKRGLSKKIVIGNNMLAKVMDCSGISAKFLVPWPEFQYVIDEFVCWNCTFWNYVKFWSFVWRSYNILR